MSDATPATDPNEVRKAWRRLKNRETKTKLQGKLCSPRPLDNGTVTIAGTRYRARFGRLIRIEEELSVIYPTLAGLRDYLSPQAVIDLTDPDTAVAERKLAVAMQRADTDLWSRLGSIYGRPSGAMPAALATLYVTVAIYYLYLTRPERFAEGLGGDGKHPYEKAYDKALATAEYAAKQMDADTTSDPIPGLLVASSTDASNPSTTFISGDPRMFGPGLRIG